MKKTGQILLLSFILAGAAWLGYKYPAYHPERNIPVFGKDHSKGESSKPCNENNVTVKK